MHSEKWGFSLAARTRTKKNRDIAADPDHDHTTCFPLPFFKAVHSVSLKNGWHLESLLLSLFNNVAFLEHRCTRLSSEVGQEIAQLSNVPEVASGPVPLPADAQAAAEPQKKKRRKKGRSRQEEEEEDFEGDVSEAAVLDPAAFEAAIEAAVASAEIAGRSFQETTFEEVLQAFNRANPKSQTEEAAQLLRKLWNEKLLYDDDGLLKLRQEEYVHEVAPAIPVLLAGPASSRKST